MNKFVAVLFVLLAVLHAASAVDEIKITIDNFIDQDTLSVGGGAHAEDTVNQATGIIIGGQRAMYLQNDGPALFTMQTYVFNGTWSIATPDQATGYASLQWDGVDNDYNVPPSVSGLGPFDATANGAYGIRLTAKADHAATFIAYFYSPAGAGDYCYASFPVPGTQVVTTQTILYTQFTNVSHCDFTKIGAIELDMAPNVAVDAVISEFSIVGPVPSPTPSNSPIPSPSHTSTATHVPSTSHTSTATHVPSASKSPSPCACDCPAFTCHLIVDEDGVQDYYWLTSLLLDIVTHGTSQSSGSSSSGSSSSGSSGSSNNGKSSSDATMATVSVLAVALLSALVF
jgi:uncharacterized membrane protein YgcG